MASAPPARSLSDIFQRLMYEEESAEPAAPQYAYCSREETGLVYGIIANTVKDALNASLRIIVDVEPTLYESALQLLVMVAKCSKSLSRSFPLVDVVTKGNKYPVMYEFTTVKPGIDEIAIYVHGQKSTTQGRDELRRDIEYVLQTDDSVYLSVWPGRPDVQFTAALYKTNLVLDSVRTALTILANKGDADAKKKLEYVGRVPYPLVLYGRAEDVINTLKAWQPPPPPNADVLRKKYVPISELALPSEFREIINRYLVVLRKRGYGSLLLIGLPRSGRKTLAAAIARELQMPAFQISPASFLSRWLGESEQKLRAFFDGLRAVGGGLAVFDGVDSLFRKGGNEEVSSNLKGILYQEMSKPDNNFIMVFTANETAPAELLDSPILGEVKLVMPLPNRDELTALSRRFLRELAGDSWQALMNIARKEARNNPEEYLYTLYANPFVEPAIGFTPGELYELMEFILMPIIEADVKDGRLYPIPVEVEKYAARDYAARLAKINKLKEMAGSLGWKTIADELEKVYNALNAKAVERKKELSAGQ